MNQLQQYNRLKRQAKLAETLARRNEQMLSRARADHAKAEAMVQHIDSLMPSSASGHSVAELVGSAALRAMLQPAHHAAFTKCEDVKQQITLAHEQAFHARLKANRIAERSDAARRAAINDAEQRLADDHPQRPMPRHI